MVVLTDSGQQLKLRQGYLNNPEATANSITPDGWFKTGDVAVIDEEGFYKIVDRRKELIKYKVSVLLYLVCACVNSIAGLPSPTS